MKVRFRLTAFGVASALAICAGPRLSSQSSASYTLIDLGTLGGNSSFATDINASGQVVGYSSAGEGTPAFLWQSGVMRNLGNLGGDAASFANSINAAGHVVGVTATVHSSAFLWQDGVMRDLGTLPGTIGGHASDINGSGQVVGYTYAAFGPAHAVLWQDGLITDLGRLDGAAPSIQASAINDAGEIVGATYRLDDSIDRAFLWKNGVMTDLGTLGGDWSAASDINASGQVVGVSSSSDGAAHAFLWQNGVMRNLDPTAGDESQASSINASGQVVGSAQTTNGHRYAVLWQNGVMTDLNTLLPAGSPHVRRAAAINDCGQIVGTGDSGGSNRAILLTPRDAAERCHTQTNPSPDGTEMPPAAQVIDATGGVWTIGNGSETFRNGVHAGDGYARSLLWRGGTLYAFAYDDQWWGWNGSSWVVYGPSRPGTAPTSPSPDGTEVPPATHLIDSTAAVWTLGIGGETLRNGTHAAGGYARSLLWSGATVYAYAWDDQWWWWTGSGWAPYGSRPGTGPTNPSPDGTALPPATHVIDAVGAVWTLGANGEILRGGVHAAGGYARSLLWSGGALYAYGWDEQWWRWHGSAWVL